MTIRSLAALLAVSFVAAACGEADTVETPSAPAKTTREADGAYVLGAIWVSEGTANVELTKLRPLTLEPFGRRIALDAPGFTTSWSPDGKTLLLGGGEDARIDLVDIARMRVRGSIDLGRRGYVATLAWRGDGTVLAAVESRESAFAVVDLQARRVVETRPVEGTLLAARPVPAGILALVAPRDRIAPVELVIFGPKGTASVTLDEITGGWENEGKGEDVRMRQRLPGLAVDPPGRRALVVSAGRTVADVRLGDLRVTYRTLSEPVSLLGRLRNWLEPPAEAKSIEGPQRAAHWIGSDLVAVAGVDYDARGDEGTNEPPAKPVGLALVDTGAWQVRTVNEKVGEMLVAGRALLALEWWCAGDEASFGVAAYDATGKKRFRLCRPTGFDVQAIGRYAYLGFEDNKRFEVVDLATGRIVAEPVSEKTITLFD